MMLSLSIQNQGKEVDLSGVVKGADEVDERIPAQQYMTIGQWCHDSADFFDGHVTPLPVSITG